MNPLREIPGYPEDLQQRLAAMQMGPSVQRMPAANPDQVFLHFDFLRSIEKHRKLAVGIFLVFLVLSCGYMAARWNNYKASALVYVQPSPPRLMSSGPAQQWPYDANTYESYIQQQIGNVTRPDVLIAAVKKIPGFQERNESDQAAADRLSGDLKVARVGNGYQISIEAAAADRLDAARKANAVAAAYIQSATRELRAGDPQRIQLLGDERDRITKELAGDRAEQEDLNKTLGVAGVGSATPNPYDDQIAAVRAELVKARTANDEAAAKLTAQTGSGPSSAALDAEADELVAADPGLVSMKTALNKRRSELISQMANLTPNHPEYKQDTEELAKINSSLESMSKDLRARAGAEITQRLKNDLERTSSVEATLNAQLAQMTATAGSATPRLQRASDLAADISRLQNRFAVVDEQYRNLAMENDAPGAVYLSAAALPPLHAARNAVMRNGLLMLIAGLIFAVGGALIAHNLDPRIYIAADVERVLGFAPMGLLPDLYEAGTGVAEEYMLRLAAAVEHAHQQGLLNSCIFTGVAPGAGATTVSKRVSNMLQAMGRATVQVDAVSAPPPLETPNPRRELIHSPRGTRSTALLQQMTQEAGEETIVVADTAPLLVSGETEYLARFVDSAIIVIESGVTTRKQLREVARTLQRLNVLAVGFVLNRISMEEADPAFRQSVHAVEKHIRDQARAFDLAAVARIEMSSRSKPTPEPRPEHDSEPAYKPAPVELPRNIVSEPTVESASHDARQQAAQSVKEARRASFVEPETKQEIAAAEPPAAASQPEPAAGARTTPEAADQDRMPVWIFKQAEPVSDPVATVPSSATPIDLDEQRARVEARTPPVAPRPARGREGTQMTPPVDQKPSPTPASADELPKAQWGAQEQSWTPGPPAQPDRDLAAEAAKAPSSKPPGPRNARGRDPVPAPAAPAAAESARDFGELPFSAASRLGGLRNLLVSLGIQNLHKEAELRKAEARSGARLAQRAIYAVRDTPGENGSPAGPLAAVTARPEFLPPRVPEIPDRDAPDREVGSHEKEPPRPVKSPPVNRWDSPEDVSTLPSRRGQYRKRH